ncbi:MAG TPA: hypothetical protein VFU69_00470, partial [Ktedonobacterales bacterium]|nr:hypothetical protein [Ktedonobacterales bacterium]
SGGDGGFRGHARAVAWQAAPDGDAQASSALSRDVARAGLAERLQGLLAAGLAWGWLARVLRRPCDLACASCSWE